VAASDKGASDEGRRCLKSAPQASQMVGRAAGPAAATAGPTAPVGSGVGSPGSSHQAARAYQGQRTNPAKGGKRHPSASASGHGAANQMSVYDLNGRKALVTGGARGLGAGMAEALSRAGAAVAIADIREELGKAAAESIRESGATAEFVPLDVTEDASWETAISQAIAALDGLDILVNNAGIEITSLFVDVDAADVRRMLDVNLLGVTLGIKHAFRAMRPGGPAGRGGAVINIASVAATIAFPGIGVYSATKSGVDRLTRVAAMESGKLGYGVRVNCVCPGLVATEMGQQLALDCAALGLFPSAEAAVGEVIGQTPLGRLGEVADMADAVTFLASEGSRFITGALVPVDGGMGM
jgi:3alpha(or 20beta)-hydroxysteroid dehydrogenase